MSAVRYRVELAGLVGGPGVSTFFADSTAAGYDDQGYVDAVDAFLSGVAVLTHSSITWTGESTVDYLDVASGEITGQNTVANFVVVGTNNNEVLAPTTQGLVKWVTGVYRDGRQILGKTFLPGPTIDLSENPGVPVAGYLGGVLAQAMLYSGAGIGASVYSRPRKGTESKPARAGAINPIVIPVVWSKWAVLRGRRDG